MTSPRFLAAFVLMSLIGIAHGNFHVMQIEEIIGGINGNTSAQAIQLRMRQSGQNVVSSGRIRAWDANGANPIILLDMTMDVASSTTAPGVAAGAGANILLTTAAFNSLMTSVPGYSTDFTLTSTIPVSYLAGGKITFESNAGAIYWAVAFGNYVGTNTSADNTNETDMNFGAPFSGVLPSTSRQGIRFTGLSSAKSSTNAADYALTADPATVRNNAGTSFVVVPEPGTTALVALLGFTAFTFARRRR